jgi:asparagine synthase (glutamine-hydrolysing)
MCYENYVITYNGEIYNFRDLRRELEREGTLFRTHSDTEVLLAAIAQWGLHAALPRLRGMFAFAVWDIRSRTLVLARDPIGIKPLYYGWSGKTFVFASELKAIMVVPGFCRELNRQALGDYLRASYIPAPKSIFRGIYKLRPGHVVTVDARGECDDRMYFDAREAACRTPACADGARSSLEETIDQLHAAIADSVRCHMVADVPVGSFLSGGIDSSLVTCLMQASGSRRVKTFSAGFEDRNFDEAVHARQIAKQLGTDHHEVLVSEHTMLSAIPTLAVVFDEPFADSSQVPTCLLAKIARYHVTVALSGDGGDELFGGYDRYARTRLAWRLMRWLPLGVRRTGRKAITRVLRVTGSDFGIGRPARLLSLLDAEDFESMYDRLSSNPPPDYLLCAEHRVEKDVGRSALRTVEDLMLRDLLTYLPDDILTKVDRSSMGVGLEVRVPLLDLRVVANALRIPLQYKWRAGEQKWIVRKILERYLPKHLFVRRKQGFRVPLAAWLRGPLRGWADDLLSERELHRFGIFDGVAVGRLWRAHVAGVRGLHHTIWDVLMLQAWLREWRCYS